MANEVDSDIENIMSGLRSTGASESAPSAAPAAAPSAVSTQDDIESVMSGLRGKPSATTSTKPPPSTTTAAPRKPTMFQQARTAPVKLEPELTWAETGSQAIRNLPRSTFEMGRAMVGAITDFPKTVDALKQVGLGLASKASGAIGVEQNAEEKKSQEAAVDNIINYYKQAYGSEAGFKRALATDPASILADFSTLVTGGATAAGKAGLISTQRASQLAKAASYVDPISASVKVAKNLTSAATLPLKMTQSGLSGVPTNVMNIAKVAGATDDPALKNAFLKFYRGDGKPDDFLFAAQDALQKVKSNASSDYLANKGRLANVNPSFQRVDDAVNAMNNEVRMGGMRAGQFADANNALSTVENFLTQWKSNPTAQTLLGFDNLKQAIEDLRQVHGSSMAQRHLGNIYNAVKNAIVDVDPAYAKLMENYSAAYRNINDITKTLGIGNKAAASTALAKNLRSLKTGKNENLLEQLAQYNPELPFMLAGASLRPWSAGGWRNTIETMLAFPSAMLVHPLAPVGQFIGQSPRIAGATSYAAGKTGALVDKATSAPIRAGLYGAGIATQAAGTPPVAEEAAAAETAVTPNVVEQIRKIEGEGENPMSSARGPFQMIDRTFINAFRQFYPDQSQGMSDDEILDLRRGPEGTRLEEQLGPMVINQSADIIGRAGKEATPGNVYLAHFLGPNDALKVLNADPSTPVDQLLSDRVISSNERLLRGKTAGEVISMMEQMMAPAAAAGGRIERRSGGRVDNVERLVGQLMSRVKQAKRANNEITKPLLDQPDEAIVKALDVAQQAI